MQILAACTLQYNCRRCEWDFPTRNGIETAMNEVEFPWWLQLPYSHSCRDFCMHVASQLQVTCEWELPTSDGNWTQCGAEAQRMLSQAKIHLSIFTALGSDIYLLQNSRCKQRNSTPRIVDWRRRPARVGAGTTVDVEESAGAIKCRSSPSTQQIDLEHKWEGCQPSREW